MTKMDDKYKSDRPMREILETDKCDWCAKKKATITDGTYVYCSEECKNLFVENAFQAIEESIKSLRNKD